jgi:hypothetical protein
MWITTMKYEWWRWNVNEKWNEMWMKNKIAEFLNTIVCLDSISKCQCNEILSDLINECQCIQRWCQRIQKMMSMYFEMMSTYNHLKKNEKTNE